MSTTIITRLYRDTKSAEAVRAALLEARQDKQTIDIIDRSSAKGAASARERMLEAKVGSEAADAYAEGVESGKALLVVRAPFVPFGTALNAIRIVDDFPSVDVGVKNQNLYVSEERRPEFGLSVLPNGPRFLTGKIDGNRGTVSEAFQAPLLTKDRPRRSAIPGGALVSMKFLPFPLLTRDRHRDSVIHGGAFVSRRIFPFPLLSRGRRRNSVIHGTPFSTILGLPLLSKRQ